MANKLTKEQIFKKLDAKIAAKDFMPQTSSEFVMNLIRANRALGAREAEMIKALVFSVDDETLGAITERFSLNK